MSATRVRSTTSCCPLLLCGDNYEKLHFLRFLFVRGFRAIFTGRWIGRGVKQNGRRQVPILLCVAFPWNCAKRGSLLIKTKNT
jgi:hypothetical protein